MLLKTLVRIIDKYKDNDIPVWLCCVPLWHIVTKRIQKPCDKVQFAKTHSARVPKWWGIDGIEGAINVTKRKTWLVKIHSCMKSSDTSFTLTLRYWWAYTTLQFLTNFYGSTNNLFNLFYIQ